MEVILNQDVEKVGKQGSVVKVKDGFARNYLIPRGLAVPKTKANLARIVQQQKKKTLDEEKARKNAEGLKERLAALSLTIPVLTQEGDAFYGSVTAQDIERALREEGCEVEKSAIVLEEPIRALGIYEIPVKLLPEVTATVKVWIVKK